MLFVWAGTLWLSVAFHMIDINGSGLRKEWEIRVLFSGYDIYNLIQKAV